MPCFEQLLTVCKHLILWRATSLLIPLQGMHKPKVIGSPSHMWLLLLFGFHLNLIFAFTVVPKKGKELALFDFLDTSF